MSGQGVYLQHQTQLLRWQLPVQPQLPPRLAMRCAVDTPPHAAVKGQPDVLEQRAALCTGQQSSNQATTLKDTNTLMHD